MYINCISWVFAENFKLSLKVPTRGCISRVYQTHTVSALQDKLSKRLDTMYLLLRQLDTMYLLLRQLDTTYLMLGKKLLLHTGLLFIYIYNVPHNVSVCLKLIC